MRTKLRTWCLLGLLLLAAAILGWLHVQNTSVSRRVTPSQAAANTPRGPGAPNLAKVRNASKRESYRLSNTRQTERQLLENNHAIILRNAIIDTRLPLKLDIPPQLRAKGAPGSYIVQAGQALDARFYDELKQAGATFVTYIPNDAALVRATPDQARQLAGDASIQAVLPYEPYYKLDTSLLPAALDQQPPQPGALNVTTFPGQRDAALAALNALGATYMGEDISPFGPTLTVMVPADKLSEVAQLPLAQEIEPYAPRRMLNDLTRVTLGVTADTLIGTSNYLNLTGSNVTVNVNDTGVDSTHPDFKGPGGASRLHGASGALSDYNGHGTHVAGSIAGNGSMSTNVTNMVPGSIIPGADFCGKATNANLFVQALGLVVGTTVAAAFQEGGAFVSDTSLQTNASVQLGTSNLISNNSWGYAGITSYDMHAASFDAATRDAQPNVKGEQPLLFVFAAGDGGNGNVNGGDGAENSILSPGTAKNVITVGAIDALRNITNQVTIDDALTNEIFFPWTDNNDLVAWFSSCGNIGPGTEGLYGRFKPEVVTPGVFIISCRSSNYLTPSHSTQVTPYPFAGQIVLPGKTNVYTLPLSSSNFPTDTEELIIEATPNSQSPSPFSPMLILGAPSSQPLALLGTNNAQDQSTNQFVVVTNGLDGVAWKFGVTTIGGQIQPVAYDLTFYLVETNDLGASITNTNGYYFVMSNLNSMLAPSYMYQYGTSMSAAAVSGMLALMQEFLQTKMSMTNPSPALLKAMLINGSRSVNQQYDFNTQPFGPNEQGWGLPNLPNSLPGSLTNSGAASIFLADQSTNDALATGQWQSFSITSSDPNATNYPIRVTLVWTDPPGDPAAGLALVNNLDLLVTGGTGTNAEIWLGNDFLTGDTFTEVNSGDSPDLVNNAQNVYIGSTNTPFTFPLTVTVLGARVNVNAVTTQTNQIAQDYALVISSDDTNAALTVTRNAISSLPLTTLDSYTAMTNGLGGPLLTGSLSNFLNATPVLVTIASNGAPLMDQRVGANEPNLYANGNLYTNTAINTNGNAAQWHFFVFTNDQFSPTNQATNVAFATFLPPNLATQIAPRTNGADLDLYVSTMPGLTNLDPAVFAVMTTNDMSLGRGGTETVIYSNSVANEVYYIGVKSEDQQAADFGFYGVAQQAPFFSENPDGSITFSGTALPVTIPDNGAGVPMPPVIAFGGGQTEGRSIRKVTVTLTIDHANPSDLIGVFQPDQSDQVVLNNRSGPPVGEIFSDTYNDLSDGMGGVNSDGPGSLRNLIGQSIPNLWLLQETDEALLQGGEITGFSVTVWPQSLLNGGPIILTLAPNQAFFGYVDVPTDAIDLTNAVTLQGSTNTGDLGIFMTDTNLVTTNAADSTNLVFTSTTGLQPAGGYLLVTTNSPLPLAGGMWFYAITNEGSTTITFTNQIFFGYNYTPNLVQTYTNSIFTPLTTDGTTNSSQICVSNGQQVLDFSVGLRLADSNLDDLVIELTSPQGSSIILFENRGGALAGNLGLTLTNGTGSNYIYTTFTEDTNLATVPIKFAPPPYASPVVTALTVLASNSFEGITNGSTFTNGEIVEGGWLVESNEVSVMTDSNIAYDGSNYLALAAGRLSQTFTTVPGVSYEFIYSARSPGIANWWPADDNPFDIVGGDTALKNDITYDVGEVGRAFTFTNTDSAVYFGTSAGNFGTNDFSIDFWVKTTNFEGDTALLEKQTGCDQGNFFNILVLGGVVHYRDSGLIVNAGPTNVEGLADGLFHHVAVVRQTTIVSIYIDGSFVNSASAASPADITNAAQLTAGVSLCQGTAGITNFTGDLDELDLWQRALSPAEVSAIFTAGSLGKYNANSLYPNFQVAFDGLATNTIIITNFAATNWQVYTNSFIATNDQTTIELSGNTLGVLLDDIQLVQLAYTNYNNYFLPEEPLTSIIGENPQGCWTLNVWDTRQDSTQPTNGALLSWTLQMTTSSTNVSLIVLTNGLAYTDTNLPPGGIAYFGVDVPGLANFATNILSGATGPMNLLFNQSALPTGALPGDVTLLSLTNGAGSNTLSIQGAPPPLVPGQRYFLGVQNTSLTKESFSLEVTFDVSSSTNITVLSNDVAIPTNISATVPEFYSFAVPAGVSMVTFQLLNPSSGQLGLYARDSLPLPGPLNFDYESENAGSNDQFIVITTNSAPVPLPSASVLSPPPTTWYLTVTNFGGASNNYTILATFVTNGGMIVIPLTNNSPLTNIAAQGYPTNLVYSFTTGPNAVGVQFTVTNISSNGNVELLADTNVFPTPDDFYIGSFNAGTNNQYVSIATNAQLPSVTNIIWYLAVPNTSSTNVTYSITASESTNGLQASPLILGASILSRSGEFTMSWRAVPGTTYQIEVSTNLSKWSVMTNFTAQTTTASYTDPVPAKTQKSRFFRLTAPK